MLSNMYLIEDWYEKWSIIEENYNPRDYQPSWVCLWRDPAIGIYDPMTLEIHLDCEERHENGLL